MQSRVELKLVDNYIVKIVVDGSKFIRYSQGFLQSHYYEDQDRIQSRIPNRPWGQDQHVTVKDIKKGHKCQEQGRIQSKMTMTVRIRILTNPWLPVSR